jgi:TRAP-type C4-dicarboxylate transport system substrate-binding protein
MIAAVRLLLTIATLTFIARPAAAETILRMAVIAPDGTAWARELKAFARDVELATAGEVRIKWYLGGIAGDEKTALERVKRGQLDGTAVSVTCSRYAPSLKITRLVGLFHRYDESHFVLNRLFPAMDQELRKSGFVGLGIAVIGSEVIFSRRPVSSMAEWRAQKLWVWDLDDIWIAELPRFGLKTIAMPVEQAGAAYDRGEIDGFLGIPTAALAFQWSTRAKYFTRLQLGFLPACLLLSTAAFDKLSVEAQTGLRGAGAKLGARFDEINRAQEEQLLNGLFERQGLRSVPLGTPQGQRFRSEFLEEIQRLQARLSEQLVPPELISQVKVWLADFRAEHP